MSFQRLNSYFSLKTAAILLILITTCGFAFPQARFSDSAEVYDYWSKRGIIEVVYAYMNDYINTVKDSSLNEEKIKNCTDEIQGMEAYESYFIKSIETFGIEKLSVKFDSLSKFMKNNNWKGAEINLLQPLYRNQKEKIVLNKEFFFVSKQSGERSTEIPGYENKMDNWDKTVNDILSEYNKGLKQLKKKPNSIDQTLAISDKTISQDDDEASNLPESKNQNWIFYLLTGIMFLLTGMLISYFLIRSKISGLLGDNEDIYKNSVKKGFFSFLSMVSLLKERKDNYKNEVERLAKEIDELKLNIKNSTFSATNKDTADTQKLKSHNEQVNIIEWKITKEDENKLISYFSIPEKDGHFSINKGETVNDGFKHYRIEYRNNSNEGELFYINGDQDKRAIHRVDSYLKPVCDIDNLINVESASGIEVLKSGKVIKVADNWEIDTNHKVKIKLV